MFNVRNDTLEFKWLPMKKAAIIQEALLHKAKADSNQMQEIQGVLCEIKGVVGKMWENVLKLVTCHWPP